MTNIQVSQEIQEKCFEKDCEKRNESVKKLKIFLV